MNFCWLRKGERAIICAWAFSPRWLTLVTQRAGLLLTLLAVAAASALTCYVGVGGDYQARDCSTQECRLGVDCLCMKSPDLR